MLRVVVTWQNLISAKGNLRKGVKAGIFCGKKNCKLFSVYGALSLRSSCKFLLLFMGVRGRKLRGSPKQVSITPLANTILGQMFTNVYTEFSLFHFSLKTVMQSVFKYYKYALACVVGEQHIKLFAKCGED